MRKVPPWGWVFSLSFWLEFSAWVLVFSAAGVKKRACSIQKGLETKGLTGKKILGGQVLNILWPPPRIARGHFITENPKMLGRVAAAPPDTPQLMTNKSVNSVLNSTLRLSFSSTRIYRPHDFTNGSPKAIKKFPQEWECANNKSLYVCKLQDINEVLTLNFP